MTWSVAVAPPADTLAFLTLSITYGLAISFAALLMEQRAFRRYPGWHSLWRLIAVAGPASSRPHASTSMRRRETRLKAR